MWIRPTSVTGYKGLWQTGTSSLLNVYLIGDQVQGVVGGSTTLFLSSTRISANVWTMISVEREGNVHRLYINGVLEASSSKCRHCFHYWRCCCILNKYKSGCYRTAWKCICLGRDRPKSVTKLDCSNTVSVARLVRNYAFSVSGLGRYCGLGDIDA
jgi:hypothetical protein